jgi:uncharacterized protein involved in response to NO
MWLNAVHAAVLWVKGRLSCQNPLLLLAAILWFCPPFLPFLLQMAELQLLRRRKTKTSKMLPPVAAVLPAEKLNETLVKQGLLPCCRFSGPLSINHGVSGCF